MRHWIAEARLAAVLNNPASTPIERASLADYRRRGKPVRGTLMQEEVHNEGERIQLCRPLAKAVPIDLGRAKIYDAVLDYVQEHHPMYRLHDWNNHLYDDLPPTQKDVSAISDGNRDASLCCLHC